MNRGIHHVHTRFEKGCTFFRIDQDPTTFECSHCGSRAARRKSTVRRVCNTLPVRLCPTLIEWFVQQLIYLVCGATRQLRILLADPDRRYMRGFARYVLEPSRHMTMADVALHLGISWHTVTEIQN